MKALRLYGILSFFSYCVPNGMGRASVERIRQCESSPPPPFPHRRTRRAQQDFGRRIEIWWGGDACYYRGTVTGYSITTRRHTVRYDDGQSEKILLDQEKHRWGGRARVWVWVVGGCGLVDRWVGGSLGQSGGGGGARYA
jgi:hypothetical protein